MTLSTEAAEKAIFQDFQLIAFFQLCPSFFAPHRKSTSIHAHEGGLLNHAPSDKVECINCIDMLVAITYPINPIVWE